MKTQFLILFLTLASLPSFACRCSKLASACAYIANESTIPVRVSFKNLSKRHAILELEQVYSDEISVDQEYHIIGDSITSCGITLEGLQEGQSYYFGFPKWQIGNDTITYGLCMSLFYKFDDDIAACKFLDYEQQVVQQNPYVYPNPLNNGEFSIGGRTDNLSSIELFNTMGQLMYKESVSGDIKEKYSLSQDFVKGVYFLTLETDQGERFIHKVLI